MFTDSSPEEPARLEALRRFEILDTASEQPFDEITFLAAHICVMPMAIISFIDLHREWFKSKVGLTTTELQMETSFGRYTMQQPDIFRVEDAALDPRFSASAVVLAYPYIRSYVGASLISSEGDVIGTLAVMDRSPRVLRPEQEEALRALARQVVTQLELRKTLKQTKRMLLEQQRIENILRESERRFRTLVESAPDGILIVNWEGRIILSNSRTEEMFGYTKSEMIDMPIELLIPERYRKQHVHFRHQYYAQPHVRPMGAGLEIVGLHRDGYEIPIEISLSAMTSNVQISVIAFIRDKRVVIPIKHQDEEASKFFHPAK